MFPAGHLDVSMAATNLENQLHSAQKNLLFLQREHASTLKGLHAEIRRLQQHCTGGYRLLAATRAIIRVSGCAAAPGPCPCRQCWYVHGINHCGHTLARNSVPHSTVEAHSTQHTAHSTQLSALP